MESSPPPDALGTSSKRSWFGDNWHRWKPPWALRTLRSHTATCRRVSFVSAVTSNGSDRCRKSFPASGLFRSTTGMIPVSSNVRPVSGFSPATCPTKCISASSATPARLEWSGTTSIRSVHRPRQGIWCWRWRGNSGLLKRNGAAYRRVVKWRLLRIIMW